MVFKLFDKKNVEQLTGKKQIIELNMTLTRTLIDHCEKLILNLNQYDKSEKVDINMQKQVNEFSELWAKLYTVTKLVVNKYCLTEKAKSDGSTILSYISQNTIINTQNPLILITELKKREDILKKIIGELNLLQDK